MEKLKSEVRSAFSHFDEINAATAVPLKYLRALCLEAMRIYPPLPLAVSRIVPKGGATVDGHFVPGGVSTYLNCSPCLQVSSFFLWQVNVSTSPFAANLSSSNFSEPYKFDPERWLTDNPTDALDACQPFLHGPRSCIGKRYEIFSSLLCFFDLVRVANPSSSNSLAWMELATIMAKIIFMYDLELVSKEVDWLRDSKMMTIWVRPDLMVRVKPRDA